MRGALGLALCAAVLAGPALAQEPWTDEAAEAIERYRLGVSLMEEEKFAAAARELRAATSLAPRFVLAHYELGRSLMALQSYPEAAESLTTCRDLILSLDKPELLLSDRLAQSAWHSDPYSHYSSAPIGEVMLLRARQNLRGLSDRSGDEEARVPAEVHLALGSAHYHQGHVEEAEAAWRAAIAEDPALGAAHNNLAAVCMQTGRLDEAQREIEAAEAAGFVVNGRLKQDLEEKTRTARGNDRD